MPKIIRLGREEHGSTLVEFAITGWLMLVLLFGVFEVLFAMYAYSFTTYAAQQGARFAMVRGETWSENVATSCGTSAPPSFTMKYNCTATASDIQNFVQSLSTGGINPGGVTINETSSYVWPGTTPDNVTTGCTTYANSKGCMVKVTVSLTFKFIPFVTSTTLSMSATSEKVILQ
jgi:Flp pilus assembly protein TadG